jgi:hypothetical protein
MPEDLLLEELKAHLQDTDTYEIQDKDDHEKYFTIQLHAVQDAIIFFKQPKLLIENPSKRYIYFLPKIHKELCNWRSRLHPKMRPIVSDTNSVMFNLAKHILPTLQSLERNIKTLITSSLAVAYNIENLNRKNGPNYTTQLATIDVESLFTKIPLDRLLDIVNSLCHKHLPFTHNIEKLMYYLKSIINFNTFQINNTFCLQKVGLPMGGPSNGTLANIYLGHLERNMSNFSGAILFLRYMDDILLIIDGNNLVLQNFISLLRSTYNLSITASYNKQFLFLLNFANI